MATLGTNVVTYLDFAKRLDSDGKVEKSVIEILSQTNEVLADMAIVEGNLPVGHKTTIRSGLPSAAWRLLNYGVQPSKGATTQVLDTCGMLEAYAQVDKSLADLNGNSAAWRMSEEKSFLEAMNQEMADTLFYGDTSATPEKFLGLAPRFSDGTLANAANAVNVVDAGGASNLTSMYLIVWSPETIHGIYPKGSRAGILMEDKGQVTLNDSQTPNGLYEGYRSHYKWDLGLTLRDWRYVVRLCNIDTAALSTAGDTSDTSPNLIKLMIKAMNLVPNLRAGKAAWYCNNTVKTYLEVKMEQKATNTITMQFMENEDVFVTRFRGVPVRRVDRIINSESHVTHP